MIKDEVVDEQAVFASFLETGRILPVSLVKKYDDAIKIGKPCPSNKQIQELTKIEIHNNLYNSISFYSLGLGDKDDFSLYEDVMKAGCFVESLIVLSLREKYGWGLPTKESVKTIVDFIKNGNDYPLIEMGAGSGLWSAVLSKKLDLDIKSFDLDLRSDTPRPKYFPVIKDDALNYIDSKSLQNILIVWPDPSEAPMQVLEKMAVGSNLIFCGPPFVTASDNFYKTLDETFEVMACSAVGGFAGNDNLFILKKTDMKFDNVFFQKMRNENKIRIKKKI